MKNKTLLKTLSTILAVLMLLCSAPLSGFVGIELPDLFSVKAEAYYTEGNFTYSVYDGEATLTGCIDATGDIVIPETLGGYPVTRIGDQAFENCENLVSVKIPEGVTIINADVFYYCRNLISVIIPDTVKTIERGAFFYCEKLISITIPNGVTSIGSLAFYNCESLETIIIPDSITYIADRAFESSGITSIVIPKSVDYIYDRTFSNCGKLTSVVIEDSVKYIDTDAFRSCGNLKTISLPKNLKTVQRNAFLNCSNIENVYYEGTDAQWNEITIYDGNDCLKNANKTFLNGGHAHVYNSSVTTEPTCTETGVKTYKCYCGNTYTESIPATGHIWGKWIVTVEPTATKEGRKVRACTVCSEAVEEGSIPKTGHGSLDSVRIYDITLEETTTEKISPLISSYGEISYSIAFASSDKTVVIVDAEGNVAALKPGTSTITCTVTASDGTEISDTCTVTVTEKVTEEPDIPNTPDEPETKFSVKVNDFTLNYKGTAKLNPEIKSLLKYNVEYSSSDESVVTVDKDGNVTATGEGTAEITVRVTNTFGMTVEDTCKVTVAKAWWQWLIVIFLFGWIWY